MTKFYGGQNCWFSEFTVRKSTRQAPLHRYWVRTFCDSQNLRASKVTLAITTTRRPYFTLSFREDE